MVYFIIYYKSMFNNSKKHKGVHEEHLFYSLGNYIPKEYMHNFYKIAQTVCEKDFLYIKKL